MTNENSADSRTPADRRKKLIEVSVPLGDINDASAYDKLPGIGAHPKNIHQWWARLPLPTARAILFASLVDDPSEDPEFADAPLEEIEQERERLFSVLRGLLVKKPHEHPEVFKTAYEEIKKSCDGNVPQFLDPFAGGGSIPLEAQRLGLETSAADINPVAALLVRSSIDIPWRFQGNPPVNPDSTEQQNIGEREWVGSEGLAQDVRYYGNKMLDELRGTLDDLFPPVTVTTEMAESRDDLQEYVGEELPVLSWLWARRVDCTNPACNAKVPLIRSYKLSTKDGREAWFEIIDDGSSESFSYKVHSGSPPEEVANARGTKAGRAKFRCPRCEDVVDGEYIHQEAEDGRLDHQLFAIVANGNRERVYLDPLDEHARVAKEEAQAYIETDHVPSEPARGTFAGNAQGRRYGFKEFSDYFTPRQLAVLTTLTDLVGGVSEEVQKDAEQKSEFSDSETSLHDDGYGARAYAESVATILSLSIDRLADYNCALSTWVPSSEQQKHVFTRQAIPMVWDFAESNVLAPKGITFENQIKYVSDAIEIMAIGENKPGTVYQVDVTEELDGTDNLLISTDPPYYDNIGYAELSDFFYVWLRQSLENIHPKLFSTMLTPKRQELVASPHRFEGDREEARSHFEEGLSEAFENIRQATDPRFPMTLYYAFKQDETVEDENLEDITLTTGWETFLESLLSNGFQVTATLPVRASQRWRMVSRGRNTLASYIVMACRPRPDHASVTSRGEFLAQLREELPPALNELQQGNIAPVDLAQAALGPGMAVFSRYEDVLEADGSSMSVRTALRLINQVLDEYLSKEEGEFDAETQFAIGWFEEHGLSEGQYGEAEVLFTAKDISGQGIREAGIAEVEGGTVRLYNREELNQDWEPTEDQRLTIWESTQQIIRTLDEDGEEEAARLISQLPASKVDGARDLAYRLFTICSRNDWSDRAQTYNNLVVEWSRLKEMAYQMQGEDEGPLQQFLDDE